MLPVTRPSVAIPPLRTSGIPIGFRSLFDLYYGKRKLLLMHRQSNHTTPSPAYIIDNTHVFRVCRVCSRFKPRPILHHTNRNKQSKAAIVLRFPCLRDSDRAHLSRFSIQAHRALKFSQTITIQRLKRIDKLTSTNSTGAWKKNRNSIEMTGNATTSA